MATYDPDKNQDPFYYSPGETEDLGKDLGELEDKYSTPEDQAEDEAIEEGTDSSSLPRKGTGRKLRENSENADEDEIDALDDKLQNYLGPDSSKPAYTKDGKPSFYKRPGDKSPGFLNTMKRRRKLVIGAGLGVSVVTIVLVVLFSFLGFFKLDFLMSNIDGKSFSRYMAASENRSLKWEQAYIRIRLTQLDPKNPDNNVFFRSNKVSTNNPLRDWYRTVMTSNFESDLANNKGIVFVNGAPPGETGRYFAQLKIDGNQVGGFTPQDIRSGAAAKALDSGDLAVIEKLDHVNLDIPGGNKEARKIIKQAVEDNTRFIQVVKRRHVRKDIANMTGVRSWRFFDTTRDKVDSKKIQIRNRLLNAILPDETRSGKFIRCLFGMVACKGNMDPSAPDNQAITEKIGVTDSTQQDPHQAQQIDTSNGEPGGQKYIQIDDPSCPPKAVCPKITVPAPDGPMGYDFEGIANGLTGIAKGVGLSLSAVNYVGILQIFSNLNKMFKEHSLSKMVMISRGIQAMGLYQVLETARDQAKSGNVNTEEYNQLMQNAVVNSARSDAWTKVIIGSSSGGFSDAGTLTNTSKSQAYCDENRAGLPGSYQPKESDYAYLCNNTRVGDGTSNASKIEAFMNSGILGKALSLAGGAYGALTSNKTIFGRIIAWTVDKVNSATSWVTGQVFDFMNSLSITGGLGKAIRALSGKLMTFLGAGPIVNSATPSGQIFNWALQGGAFTAESAARNNGAAVTNDASAAASKSITYQYQQSQQSQMSVFARYFSPSNYQSPVANTMFAISNLSPGNLISKLGSIFSSIPKVLLLPFTHSANAAATSDGNTAAAAFAGIPTYDFPQECYDLDPLNETSNVLAPAGQRVSNVYDIFRQFGLTSKIPQSLQSDNLDGWALLTNSQSWYSMIYQALKDRIDSDQIAMQIYNKDRIDSDQIAMQIYNCALLDNVARGGIGAVYGYTSDDGLNEGSSASASTAPSASDCTNVDQSAGNDIPAQYKDAIAKTAPNRSYPGLCPTPNGAVPSDGRQYYAAWVHDKQITSHDGHHWITIKYRDPPLNGNTIEVPID